MNYIDAQKGMTKTALSAGTLKLLGKVLPRTAQRLSRSNHARLFGKTRLIRRLLGPVFKDTMLLAPKGAWAGIRGLGHLEAAGFKSHPIYTTLANLALGAGGYNLLTGDKRQSKLTRFTSPTFDTAGKAISYVGDALGGGIEDAGKKLNSPSGPIATTKFSPGALVSTFNPISGITGGKDYVPAGLVSAIQKVLPGHKGELAAHAVTKVGASALLAAGLVGAYRAAKHVGDLGSIDSKSTAGKGMSSQLSTTFSGNLGDEDEQKKTAAEGDIMAPANFSVQNLTGTALPLASMLLAAGLTYKGVDAAFDKIRNKRLDNAISQKEQAVKNLITARARLAKGDLSDANVQDATATLKNKDIYTKAASQNKEAVVQEGVQLFGTLSAALLLASAIGSYAYTSASDENNLKYKAYKKALREYAKNKSGMTPITVAPKDAPSYFAAIDAAKEQKLDTPRDLPAYDADALNKPISVSF